MKSVPVIYVHGVYCVGGLWSMVFTAAQSSSSSSTSTVVTSPLAHLALHLLLVLTNYFQQKGQKNPFHFSLACIADDRGESSSCAYLAVPRVSLAMLPWLRFTIPFFIT